MEETVGIKDLIYEHWGFFFFIYSLIVSIIAATSYVGLIRLQTTELLHHISISLAIGVTLQLIPYLIPIIKKPSKIITLLSSLPKVNLGVFFYVYAATLLWPSTIAFQINNLPNATDLLTYGTISLLIGLHLHIISTTISLDKKKYVPFTLASLIAVTAAILSFQSLDTGMPPATRVILSIGYLTLIILSYVVSAKVTGSIVAGLFSTLIIALNPLTRTLNNSGQYQPLIFSITYLTAMLLLTYFRNNSLAVPLMALTVTTQVLISQAYPLTLMLAILLATSTRSIKRTYSLQTFLATLLIIIVYLQALRQDIIQTALNLLNIYYLAFLIASTAITLIVLTKNRSPDASTIMTTTVPLLIGLPFYFEDAYTALILLSLSIAPFSVTYLFKSITINKTQEEVEVNVELDKLLPSIPIIVVFFLSI